MEPSTWHFDTTKKTINIIWKLNEKATHPNTLLEDTKKVYNVERHNTLKQISK